MTNRDLIVDVITQELRAAGYPPAGFDGRGNWFPGPHVCRDRTDHVRLTWDGSPGTEVVGIANCETELLRLGYDVRRDLTVDYGRLEIRRTANVT